MDPLSDEKIVDSWKKNSSPWTNAVRMEQIESRRLVTNDAIIEAVLSHSPRSVLDVGCGEGWLIRALAQRINHLVGVDAVPDLIAQATAAGGGHFVLATYESLESGSIKEPFDVILCNFSLLGEESVEALFDVVPLLLNRHGTLIVQTVHPLMACGNLPYVEGWRKGSWADFSDDFIDPAPWYFRTIGNWISLFSAHGFGSLEVREPLHPETGKPASIILMGRQGHKQ